MVYRNITLTVLSVLVIGVSSAGAGEVGLVGGDMLQGTVVEQTDTHVVLEHSALGRLEIARDQITSLVVETPPEEGGGGAEPAKEEKKKDVEWDSHVNLAFNGATGNTEETSFRVGGKSLRKTPGTRLGLDAAYYVSTTESTIDNNKFTSGIVHDWLIQESRWFFFADGRYDYDQFESWRHRVAAHSGPGYDLIEWKDFSLDIRAGVGPRKEWGSDEDDWKPEGLLASGFEWKISKRQRFNGKAAFFQTLNDIGNYRTRTTTNWSMKMSNDLDLSVTAGLTHEFQNVVDPSKKKNDLRVFTGLQFDF